MSRLWLHAAGSVAGAAAAVAVARAAGEPYAWGELVFLSVLLLTASVAVRLAMAEVRAASRARTHAAALERVPPEAAAREAVVEERRRLSVDILRRLRAGLDEVAVDAEVSLAARTAGVPVDLAPVVSRIHGRARDCAAELRRQIGLLRDAEADLQARQVPAPERFGPRDLLLGGAAVGVAVVDLLAEVPTSGAPFPWGSAVSTVAAAALLGARRRSPLVAVAALGGVHLLGTLAGVPPLGGFWFVLTVPALLWTAGARTVSVGDGRRPDGVLPAVVLAVVIPVVTAVATVAVIGWSTWTVEPDNVALAVLLASCGWVAGLVAGRSRQAAGHALARVSVRQARLDEVRRAAVAAERQVFAREIHDVVSHAVGVVAVQASAAQVVLDDRPDRALASLRVVADTAREAVAELDRLGPLVSARPRHTTADVDALAGRIRAAGTPVDLRRADDLPEHGDVVFRIVQECLTNVVRHGRGAAATVTIARDGAQLRVVVQDDGSGSGPAPGASGSARGYGLVGLAERVSAAGGELTAGPDPSGRGFRVEARLPAGVPTAGADGLSGGVP